MKSELWSLNNELWSVNYQCEVWTMKCELWTEKSELWTVKYEVWSVKSERWSVKYELWSVKSELWSVKFEAWRLNCVKWSDRVVERLALPTSDRAVSGSNPTGRFIAQSLSCSPFHRPDMTDILLNWMSHRKSSTHELWTLKWQFQLSFIHKITS